MRKSRYARIVCNHCGKWVSVSKDGRIFDHVAERGSPLCVTSGATVTREEIEAQG